MESFDHPLTTQKQNETFNNESMDRLEGNILEDDD